MSLKKPIGGKDITQEKVIRNPKYERVGPRLDTGMNMRKYTSRYGEPVFVRKAKSELFRRVRPIVVAQLVSERTGVDVSETASMISSPSSVATIKSSSAASVMLPFAVDDMILLDVRPEEEYQNAHIETALSYPSSMLSRVMNPFLPEMLKSKNVDGTIIVVYDMDERTASTVATILFEKGFDNIFLMTGGLAKFVPRFPSLISGDISSISLPPPSPATPKGKRGKYSSLSGSSLVSTATSSSSSLSSVSSSSVSKIR